MAIQRIRGKLGETYLLCIGRCKVRQKLDLEASVFKITLCILSMLWEMRSFLLVNLFYKYSKTINIHQKIEMFDKHKSKILVQHIYSSLEGWLDIDKAFLFLKVVKLLFWLLVTICFLLLLMILISYCPMQKNYAFMSHLLALSSFYFNT